MLDVMTSGAVPSKQYVIIGGVAGGMSAATRLRRLDERASIIALERSGHVSFANCGLPYHVGGVIEQRSALLLQTPQSLAARFAVDVRVHTEAIAIDREQRTVTTRHTETGAQQTIPYDALVLSPGARPVRPPIPGIERALGLRDIEDTDAIVAALAQAQSTAHGARQPSAVVIGGGFIGLEITENLLHRGMPVSLVEAAEQVMAPMDPEMVAPVHRVLREAGVDLRLGRSVTAIGEREVTLDDGTVLPAEIVVAAIGVRPDTSLAEAAGLRIGPRGGIMVDEHLRTSDPAIYAVGDAVEKVDALTREATLVPLANTANLQGRRVADIICGQRRMDRPVLGTAIVAILGLQVAATGWNEKRLRAAGRAYRALHSHPASHAGYYPGAEGMMLKLLVDPETDAILGAQGVGKDGIDKRIDVIATAITGHLTASELAELELAYAPQFGSAKDPVNLLGHMADNLRTGHARTIQWHELAQAQREGATVIDVRTAAEFERGSIPGAVNLPVDDLRDRMPELPGGPLVVTCAVGLRGYLASRILTQAGRADVRNLDGGYCTWRAGVESS